MYYPYLSHIQFCANSAYIPNENTVFIHPNILFKKKKNSYSREKKGHISKKLYDCKMHVNLKLC